MSDYKGPERRELDQKSFYAAIAKIETVPTQITALKEVMQVELASIRNDIKNIEEKIMGRVESIEDQLGERCKSEEAVDRILDEHDRSFEKAKSYIREIEDLKVRVGTLEKDVDSVKNASKEYVYAVVKNILSKLGGALLLVVSAAIIFAITNPTFWQEVFARLRGE